MTRVADLGEYTWRVEKAHHHGGPRPLNSER